MRFFGGAPPPISWVEALDAPVSCRVRPDLLTREDAHALVRAGVVHIELDALSFSDEVLRETRRPYRGQRIQEMCRGLRALGANVGIVLAPGLPRSSHATCLTDARIAAPLVDTVRIHPVLVLQGSSLEQAHYAGTYTPLELGQAVTVCRDLLDLLETAGVEVIRVGQQPGPDGLGRVSAGPYHASLRELVEALRTLDRVRPLFASCTRGESVILWCAPADETRTRGPMSQNLRTLRAEHGLQAIRIATDPGLRRGHWRLQRDET